MSTTTTILPPTTATAPTIAATSGTSTVVLTDDEQHWIDALAPILLDSLGDDYDESDSRCSAEVVVTSLGVDRFINAGLTAEDLDNFGLLALLDSLSDAEQGSLEASAACLEDSTVASLQRSGFTGDQAQCFWDAVLADERLLDTFQLGGGAISPDPVSQAAATEGLAAVYRACLPEALAESIIAELPQFVDEMQYAWLEPLREVSKYADVPNAEFPGERIDGFVQKVCADLDDGAPLFDVMTDLANEIAGSGTAGEDEGRFAGVVGGRAVLTQCPQHSEALEALGDEARYSTLGQVLEGTKYADVPNAEFPVERLDAMVDGVCADLDGGGALMVVMLELADEIAGSDTAGEEESAFAEGLGAMAVDTKCPHHSAALDQPTDLGDDPNLDALWERCADGEYPTCDLLWWFTLPGSGYFTFGATCGEVNPENYDPETGIDCTTLHDVPLDIAELQRDCEAGDSVSCDVLFLFSPEGSPEEAVAQTCGGRNANQGVPCVFLHGVG